MTHNVYMTSTAVRFADESGDVWDERHGWVQPSWSYTVQYDERDDAGPVWTCEDWDEDEDGDMYRTVAHVLAGYGIRRSVDNGERGTFYLDGHEETDDEGFTYSYAFHLDGFTADEIRRVMHAL